MLFSFQESTMYLLFSSTTWLKACSEIQSSAPRQVHLTDGDVDEFLLIHLCIKDKVFPNAVHFLCLYHGFTQSWQRYVTADKLIGNIKHAHDWIWTWLFVLETVPELEDSKSCFFEWTALKEVKEAIGFHLMDKLMKFVHVSIIPNLPLLALPYWLYAESMDEQMTSSSKLLNSATKFGPAASHPNMSVAKSGGNMLLQKELQETKHAAMNQAQFIQSRTWLKHDSAMHGLTNYMAGLAMTFIDAARNFTTTKTSLTTWLVYCKPFREHEASAVCWICSNGESVAMDPVATDFCMLHVLSQIHFSSYKTCWLCIVAEPRGSKWWDPHSLLWASLCCEANWWHLAGVLLWWLCPNRWSVLPSYDCSHRWQVPPFCFMSNGQFHYSISMVMDTRTLMRRWTSCFTDHGRASMLPSWFLSFHTRAVMHHIPLWQKVLIHSL